MDTGPHPTIRARRRGRETTVDELFSFGEPEPEPELEHDERNDGHAGHAGYDLAGPADGLVPVEAVDADVIDLRDNPASARAHARNGTAEAPVVVLSSHEEDPDQLTVGGPLLPVNVRGGPAGRVGGGSRDGMEGAGVAAARAIARPRSRAVEQDEPRLRVVADVNGPRIRLGLAWFVLGGGALLLHRYLAAAVFTAVAATGAIQAATALRRRGHRTNPYLAGAAAALVTVAGVAPSSSAVGLAVLVAVVVSLISGLHYGGFDLESSADTIRSWLGVAIACAGPVVFARYETALGVLLFLLVCSYDAGDFLVGTASSNSFEGPLAGLVGVLAVGCGAAILHPWGLADHQLWPAVLLAAAACPVGQLLGSITLPTAGAFAPALRRVDSLIAVSLIWLVLFA